MHSNFEQVAAVFGVPLGPERRQQFVAADWPRAQSEQREESETVPVSGRPAERGVANLNDRAAQKLQRRRRIRGHHTRPDSGATWDSPQGAIYRQFTNG